MKKVFTLCVAFILISLVGTFGVFAADYSYGDMKLSVPDFLTNDAQWAESSGFKFAFSDSDVNMELNISVYDNEDYSYEGLDEDNLNDYAQFLREKYETGDYSPVESVTVTSYSTKEGIAGIRSDLIFEDEQYVFYWFATEELCYDFNFYIYNSEFLSYPQQIIETLVIGTAVDQTEAVTTPSEPDETMPVLSDDDVEADGDGQVKQENNYSGIMSFPWPAIIFAVALISLIVLLIVKRKKRNDIAEAPAQPENNGGIYFDPATGNYYRAVSPDENIAPGQPVGYIYYPVQGNQNQQDNNNSKQN